MDEMIVFEDGNFGKIRTVIRNDEPWFVAADVCRALEVGDAHVALRRLDDDEKGGCSVPTPGGNQNVSVVSEPGLYSLALGSRKPEARAFKRWITHEVIPSIRKRGMYATPQAAEAMLNDPDVMIRALQEIKSEREKRKALEEKAALDAPRIKFAEMVEGSADCVLIGTLAKMMKQNGVNIGEKRLFQRLRDDGYLCKRGDRANIPTQAAMNLDLFAVSEYTFYDRNGIAVVRPMTKVTGKGQIFFMNKYGACAGAR